MYNSEELFIDKFIACLKKLDVPRFPFDNEKFYNGIESMKQYFCYNKNQLGEFQDEIAMLFIKQPLERVFTEFRNAITKQNGWYIAFENPEYVVASIKLDDNGASYILEQDDLNINTSHMLEFAKAFCKGADIIC